MEFTEKLLYHIWDAQHLLPGLKTNSKKSLKVLYPGRWNTDAGPDFKDAILEIDGEVKRGDVELELNSCNWHQHNHDENSTFNSVILHVVYKHNSKYDFTISENGTRIEILELEDKVDDDISKLLKKYENDKYKESPKACSFFADNSNENIYNLLNDKGKARFESKIKRFQAEHYFANFDQLLWQGLMEALGYSKNKYQMLQLALYVKFADLKKIYQQDRSIDRILALLLGAADLLDKLPASFPLEIKQKWQNIFLGNSSKIEPLNIQWKLFRIRPVNHPALRILQIAELIQKGLENSLFNNILKIFSEPEDKFSINKFRKKLYAYFFNNLEIFPENVKLGKTRIDTILVNILLPLTAIYAREKQFDNLMKTVQNIYEEYPGLPANYISTHMEKFMTQDQKISFKNKAIIQQGILKLYYENCQFHACEDCKNLDTRSSIDI